MNGFTLLRQAYEATEPGFDGHVSVPTLWDRATGVVVSNTFAQITLDLATAFRAWARPDVDTYPVRLRPQIDALNERILVAVNHGVSVAAGRGEQADAARRSLLGTLEDLDRRLAGSRYLHGDTVTESDVRLWVTLVRYDVAANAGEAIGPRRLVDYPNLWPYARDLYQQPAFRESTDFASFSRSEAPIAEWDAPHGRGPDA